MTLHPLLSQISLGARFHPPFESRIPLQLVGWTNTACYGRAQTVLRSRAEGGLCLS